MVVTCADCGQSYDDAYHWTFCPHAYFEMQTMAVRADGQSKVCRSIEELDKWLGASHATTPA